MKRIREVFPKKNKVIYPYIESLESFLYPNSTLKKGDFILSTKTLFVKEIDIKYLSDPIIANHRRLSVFSEKGCKCFYCDAVGTRLILNETPYVLTVSNHIDLYTDEMILMTIDHITPVAEKGKTEIENLVPCCRFCNNAKGKRMDISVEEILIESTRLKDKYLKQCKKI